MNKNIGMVVNSLYLVYCQILNRIRLTKILDMDYIPNYLLLVSSLRRHRDLNLRISGRHLHVPASDVETFREVFVFQEYATNISNIDYVVDLGGNIGLSTVYFKKIWPDAVIHVFEPIPNHLTVLRKNVELYSDIIVHPYAVGSVSCELMFSIKGPGSTSCDSRSSESLGTVSCVQTDIFDLVNRSEFSGRGCLKLDIEGSEWHLFDDDRFTGFINRFGIAFIEVHEFTGRSIEEFESRVLNHLVQSRWEYRKIRSLDGWASVYYLHRSSVFSR